jgi:hypothetical protein
MDQPDVGDSGKNEAKEVGRERKIFCPFPDKYVNRGGMGHVIMQLHM